MWSEYTFAFLGDGMGRKKKMTEEQLENTQLGLTIENESEMEAEEAELLAEPDTESEEAAVTEEGEEVEMVEAIAEESEDAPKPRRQRKPRKPRAAKVEKVEEVEAPAIAVAAAEMVGPVENVEAKLREELVAAIQAMSTSITANFEKMSQASRPNSLPMDPLETADLIRPQAPQTLLITKFATAASLVAVLLSLVSLSLSQSARQTAIAMETGGMRRNSVAVREAAPVMKNFPTPKELTKGDSSDDMMKKGTPWMKRTRR